MLKSFPDGYQIYMNKVLYFIAKYRGIINSYPNRSVKGIFKYAQLL